MKEKKQNEKKSTMIVECWQIRVSIKAGYKKRILGGCWVSEERPYYQVLPRLPLSDVVGRVSAWSWGLVTGGVNRCSSLSFMVLGFDEGPELLAVGQLFGFFA
jgi:hypothetical protein